MKRSILLGALLSVGFARGAGAAPDPAPDVTFRGETGGAEDSFGWSVAPAGDVNDDGHADLVVGAPTNDHVAGFAGRAYLFLGPFSGGEVDAEDADAIVDAEAFGDNLGISACGAGDVNGDGFGDILVGARGHDEPGIQSGRVYLFHGPLGGTLGLAQADAVISGIDFEELGNFVAAGDVNGDGASDLVIGAHQYAASHGRAYVFYGPVQGSISSASADASVTGVQMSDYLGSAIAVADVNGDAIDDVILGAPHAPIDVSSPGFAYVFFGPLSGAHSANAADVIVQGEELDDRFGISVSAGDVNGDGAMDLVVGADDIHDHTPGKAYLFLGPLLEDRFAFDADASFTGEANDDVFGCAVAANGDADGDGNDDVLVGAWDNQAGGARAGRAYLFLGPLSGAIPAGSADRIVTGGQFGDRVGAAVAWVGDLDGTGGSDALIGAPQFPDGAPGEAYLYFDGGPVVGLPPSGDAPAGYRLSVPTPNPAAASVWIAFETPSAAAVRISVHDVQGRVVRRLFEGVPSSRQSGILWDGRADSGRDLPSGVYVCRLASGGKALERKLTLIR
jgi:hypothetical protein